MVYSIFRVHSKVKFYLKGQPKVTFSENLVFSRISYLEVRLRYTIKFRETLAPKETFNDFLRYFLQKGPGSHTKQVKQYIPYSWLG